MRYRHTMRLQGEFHRSLEPLAGRDGIRVLDQTRLPHSIVWLELRTASAVREAIERMCVRGAPLIGACGAFGLALALREAADDVALERAASEVGGARPTAVNLRWAVERVQAAVAPLPVEHRALAAWEAATAIAEEDVAINEAIGRHGEALLAGLAARIGRGSAEVPLRLMTHCNAGWLATVDWGTALAPIYRLHGAGVAVHVWASETRPRNQGALTVFELAEAGVPCSVVADNAAGVLMAEGKVDAVIVGCDRVAANGDVANKVGTYLKALAAREHGVPFYVAMPAPTFDARLATGAAIPLERRSMSEVLTVTGRGIEGEGGMQTCALYPEHVAADNPAFDVTPTALVTAYLTERGVFTSAAALRAAVAVTAGEGR